MTHHLATADLCDQFPQDARVLVGHTFHLYGRRRTFAGTTATLKVFEDNVLVRQRLETPGQGRVLVVDGGASPRCALLGDRLATLARDNQWAGVLVYGCIRDAATIRSLDVGVAALGTSPRKSNKRGEGLEDVPLEFGGLRIAPGQWIAVDEDGVVLLSAPPQTWRG